MKDKLLYGKLSKNIDICSNNYMEDKDILLAIDGIKVDKKIFNNIKNLYIKKGENFINEIDDLYSIYLYDKKNNSLFIARDRIGLKSVYYSVKKDSIIFGNDIIDLVNNYKIKKEINIKSLSMYFRFHYINPPETIFKGINKLVHGTYLIYKNGKINIKNYWSEIEKFNNTKTKEKDKEKILEEMNKILKKSLSNFLKTEKNIGFYMSGGIDSSLVAAICSKLSPKKIDTFSIGFYEKENNEAEKSKRIANYLGTNHHEFYIDKETALDTVKRIPKYYTEPFGDVSALATIILNEFAKKNGVTTAFTGDGADQLFCGSNVYDTISRSQKAHKFLNPFNINFKNKYVRRNRRLMYIFSNSDKRYQAQCDILAYDKNLEGLFLDNGDRRFKNEERINSKNWQERRMVLDLGTFISDRINNKVNVASNRNGIEIRSPFLKHDMIEYSYNIPHKYKYYKKTKKYILKELLYRYVPKEYFESKKRGFAIPTYQWLRTYFYKELKDFCKKDYVEKQGIFDYKVINNLLKDIDNKEITNILWDYYIFQLWYKEYMN